MLGSIASGQCLDRDIVRQILHPSHKRHEPLMMLPECIEANAVGDTSNEWCSVGMQQVSE
jgi:hypothetical protein